MTSEAGAGGEGAAYQPSHTVVALAKAFSIIQPKEGNERLVSTA